MLTSIIATVLPIIYLLLSWFYLNKKEELFDANFYYYSGLFLGSILLGMVTWYDSPTSITTFYLCIVLLVIYYFSFYAYTLSFFKRLTRIKNKRRPVIALRIVVIVIRLVLLFWIVILFGKFLHDNSIIETENLYDYIPEYTTFLELIKNWKEEATGTTTAIFGFLKIGVLQFFESANIENWNVFIQSFKWVYGSVILVFVLNIMFSILGFGNVNITKDKEEQ